MAGATHARYPDLAGRTVFVSGGGSGIGAAIVRGFVAQRARFAFVDIDDAASHALAAERGSAVRYTRCDVRDIEALQRVVEAMGLALESE